MKQHFESDDVAFPADAYAVEGWRGVAFHVLGWQTMPDEDTEWTGIEERTGKVVLVMVGDDRHFVREPVEIRALDRTEYCGGCGQIGCTGDGLDRD